MKYLIILLIIIGLNKETTAQERPFGLVIHGGAGWISPERFTEEEQKSYHAALASALDAGYQVLNKGGQAHEAVIAAIKVLEDDPKFNAGKGSVLNSKGKVEMDAAIMTGHDLSAGAVAGVRKVKNPILGALAVMKNSPHVMLAGEGADLFCKEQGLKLEPQSYFITDEKKESLKGVKHRSKIDKHGTVGCVALDKQGNLAAGTSTGGMTNKAYNRIGDAPVIGAGTYADNRSCAVSCTGHGEYFIRLGIAKEVAALVKHKGYDVYKAAHVVIHEDLSKMGGTGGLITIDRNGNIAMPFNTPGMFRGYQMNNKPRATFLFSPETEQ